MPAFHRRFGYAEVLAALFLSLSPLAQADEIAVPIDQGWSAANKITWYTLSQGSRLVPLSWMQALEQPGSDKLFLDPAFIEKFRYLPNAAPAKSGLPVGFAVDKQDDSSFSVTKLRWKSGQRDNEPWVGMNCAACHTNDITYQGKRMRIEGAPTLADFQGFMESLNKALAETKSDSAKFMRFAGKIFSKSANTPANRAMLNKALSHLIDWQSKIEGVNATPLRYGFARLDAFGHIFNKVLLRLEADGPQPHNPSDAPVSYPFLWNIHQQDKVQWNGIAPNFPISESLDVGALGRNVGEVLGVFGDVKLLPVGPAIDGYRSSLRIGNLVQLEQLVSKLEPPAWPDVFPAIDAAKWEAGKNLFHNPNGGCVTCHDALPRNDLHTKVEVAMTPLGGPNAIGTDPWMACNAYTYEALSGVLRYTPKKFVAFSSPPLKENAALADMLGTVVIGVLWNKRDDVLESLGTRVNARINVFDQHKGPVAFNPNELLAQLLERVSDATKAERLTRCMTETSPILAYKGRPLTGIWATPPYLHNGSVPTLYDLLLPPSERPTSFSVGTREFDPVKVGYITHPTADNRSLWPDDIFEFRARDEGGQPIPGNANTGHDYGNAAFQPEDRMALVEYMKAVGGRREGNKIIP